jgi:hypothetical protein
MEQHNPAEADDRLALHYSGPSPAHAVSVLYLVGVDGVPARDAVVGRLRARRNRP